jgi:hypothetical protein
LLSFTTQFSNCPVDRIDLIQVIDGREKTAISDISSGAALDFSWNDGNPEPKNEFILKGYSGSFVSGQSSFTLDFGEDLVIEISPSLQVCLGASTKIGVKNNSNYSYEWISATAEHLIYISDPLCSKPSFTAFNPGTYDYNLIVTNLETGCAIQKTTSVNVAGIDAINYNVSTIASANPMVLQSPTNGGGSDYEYEWSPPDHLDNPRSANPIFTPPNYGEDLNYAVNISFRNCTEAVASVAISVTNTAATLTDVASIGLSTIGIDWSNNSDFNTYILQRSDGTGFTNIAYLDNGNFSFIDSECLDPYTDYCYRIMTNDIRGEFVGMSNEKCVRPSFFLLDKWEVDIPDVNTGVAFDIGVSENDMKLYRVGQVFERDEGGLAFLTVFRTTWGTTKGNYENLMAVEIDSETGLTTNTSISNISYLTPYIRFQSATPDGSGGYLMSYVKGPNQLHQMGHYRNGEIVSVLDEQGYRFTHGTENSSIVNLERSNSGFTLRWSDTIDSGTTEENETAGIRSFYTFMDGVASEVSYEQVSTPNSVLHGFGAYKNSVYILPFKNSGAHDFDLRLSWRTRHANTWQSYQADLMLANNNRVIRDVQIEAVRNLPYALGDHLLFGTTFQENSVYGDSKFYFSQLETRSEGLTITYSKEFQGEAGTNSKLVKVIRVNSNELLLIGTSNSGIGGDKSHASTGTDIWVMSIDEDGNKYWDYTVNYDYADQLFDAILLKNGNLLFAAIKDKQNRIVNLKMVVPIYRNILVESKLCISIPSSEEFYTEAEHILVGEECDINFNEGSSSVLKASKDITINPGTHIHEGATLTAVSGERIQKNCDIMTGGRYRNEVAEVLPEYQAIREQTLMIQPNPNQGSFSIDLSSYEKQKYSIALHQINGNKVWEEERNLTGELHFFQTENLPSGLYLLNIHLEKDGVRHTKVQIIR